MPERLTFVTDEELHVHACVTNGKPATPQQLADIANARRQAGFLQYALRELGRDGKKHEPKKLRWADVAPLCRALKEPAHV